MTFNRWDDLGLYVGLVIPDDPTDAYTGSWEIWTIRHAGNLPAVIVNGDLVFSYPEFEQLLERVK